MGVLKQGLLVIALAIVISLLPRLFISKLPLNFDGSYHPTFKRVADVFRENLNSGKEQGASFAVYYKGEFLLDLWGGYADVDSRRPWKGNTMSQIFSCSKGVAAIVVSYLVEKGFLDYKKPVSHYWPEFAQNEKDNITVEMLLSHQAGLAVLDERIHMQDVLTDHEKVEKNLAAQRTVWPAGSAVGYHAITYGLYVDTLVSKVDPQHRNTAQIFREEIASNFDIDLYLNAPLEEYHRVARLYFWPGWRMLAEAFKSEKYWNMFFNYLFSPDSLAGRAGRAVYEFDFLDNFNNPDVRQVTISAATGTGTARGLAKLYGILGNDGQNKGKQLLHKSSVEALKTIVKEGTDMTILYHSRFGPGTLISINSKGHLMYGHSGYGGQVGFADSVTGLGIAYVTNFPSIYGAADDPRYLDVEKVLYECFEEYLATRDSV